MAGELRGQSLGFGFAREEVADLAPAVEASSLVLNLHEWPQLFFSINFLQHHVCVNTHRLMKILYTCVDGQRQKLVYASSSQWLQLKFFKI